MTAPTTAELDELYVGMGNTRNQARTVRDWRTKPVSWATRQILESLARADAHVSRCTSCGTQTWDGRCGTCAGFHDTKKRKAA
jgi:recombinational DNA repair protein RecR